MDRTTDAREDQAALDGERAPAAPPEVDGDITPRSNGAPATSSASSAPSAIPPSSPSRATRVLRSLRVLRSPSRPADVEARPASPLGRRVRALRNLYVRITDR